MDQMYGIGVNENSNEHIWLWLNNQYPVVC